MRMTIWLCASVCLAACATELPRNDDVEATGEAESFVMANVRASDSPETLHAAAVAASAAACHGFTLCTGGTYISGPFTVDCGSPVCGLTGCGKPGAEPRKVFKEQPREQYTVYGLANGTVCFAYQPAHAGLLTSCCLVAD